MVYDIVTEPNKFLHIPTARVMPQDIKTREIQKFIKDLVETMYVKDGVGLAAIQVGKSLSICTIVKAFNTLNPNEDLCLINPTWQKISRHTGWDEEGCLSVPGWWGQVKRYTKIKVKAYDKYGKQIEFEASDYFARIIQHEVDHLNGHLFIEKAKNLHQLNKSDTASV